MIPKKYGLYAQEKQYSPLYYNRFNNYTAVITTNTKLQIAINILHSPEINIQ